ncbi:senescence-associated protein-domain-containing protein [Naematelia encephala]|uniref:Senescence-associated protein-domain-containing protein n=1 Tax=Naematelia encephala TaxID=71784 RepID=A0A1Y2BDL6_9TREE|nr:senescence-associated protein-domain-containing protein [Naematelia encephala]
MSRTASPIPHSGTVSPAPDNDGGYLLLTIQHATVKQLYDEQTMVLARGEMRLECVPVPIPAEIGHQTANPFSPSPSDPAVPVNDFWLILRVGPTFEMPVVPLQEFTPSPDPDGIAYTVASHSVPNASLILILPKPSSAADMDDLESFEVLLRQYKSLGAEATALTGVTAPLLGTSSPQPLPEDMRGRLMLVNKDNGEVVGELDHTFDLEEHKSLAQDPKSRPVLLDFGDVVDGYSPTIKVRTIPEDELDDWMLRGAHEISRGILSFSSWSQRMISSGSEAFIKHSTPRAEPVKFGPNTKAGIRIAHNASVKTVKVTKSTMGMINNAISTVVEKTYDKGVKPVMETYSEIYPESRKESLTSASRPPPLPPRNAAPSPAGSRRPPPPIPASRQGNESPSHVGEKIPLPTETDKLLAEEQQNEKRLVENPNSTQPTPPPSAKQAKRPFINRLLLAGEVVLTSLEATANDLINTSTVAASNAAGYKYGPEAGKAAALLGGSVRNVTIVYVDIRGVGRQALLKSTAKGFVKARLKDGQEVQLQGEGREGQDGIEVEAGVVEKGKDGAIVVGMQEIGSNANSEVQDLEKRGLSKA